MTGFQRRRNATKRMRDIRRKRVLEEKWL